MINLFFLLQGSLEEWLKLLRLEEYQSAFLDQGYQTVDAVAQLTWEDLEEFGIVKLGHQKKIMLAIKRFKDLRAGKRISTADMNRSYTQQVSDNEIFIRLDHETHSCFVSFRSKFQA